MFALLHGHLPCGSFTSAARITRFEEVLEMYDEGGAAQPGYPGEDSGWTGPGGFDI